MLITVAIINQLLDQAGAALVASSAVAVQVIGGVVVDTITLSFAALTTAILFFDLLARKAPDRSAGG